MIALTVLGEDERPIGLLVVKRACARCFPGASLDDVGPVMLASRYGVAHASEDFGMTSCGRDATGDGWWWRL